jgi:hypothetical protein
LLLHYYPTMIILPEVPQTPQQIKAWSVLTQHPTHLGAPPLVYHHHNLQKIIL